MKYKIVLEQDEDEMFIAECPILPGCISQGNTRQEAVDNIKDAIKGYLESIKKHNEPISKIKEDLEFARRTEEDYKRYEKGEFIEMSKEDFLKELEKWTKR